VVLLTDIILVKTDPIINQSSIRAEQIVRSLRKKYSVIALGWNRGEGTHNKLDNNTNLLHVFDLSAPYGSTFLYLAILPMFWTWVLIKLCMHRPKIIHAFNLDTLLPCYFYKVLFRSKLIFDMHDRYAMAFIPWNRGTLLKKLHLIVNYLEENFANNTDVLISVYDKMFTTLKRKPRNCITIMASPEDQMINRTKVARDSFKLLFTGHVREGRGLDKLLEILEDIKNTELLVMGRVEDRKLLQKTYGISNCKYIGFLDHNQLLDLELSSDAIIALYDSNLQTQHEYGMANKILEAMMCGLPVITNIAHEIITETECGILVEYDNIKQIKQAIIALRDNPELRSKLGNNGRRAFLEKYNWTTMEDRLFKIYDTLFSGIE
jgi:glycosyltransferase involved in cell wall biosynthesis